MCRLSRLIAHVHFPKNGKNVTERLSNTLEFVDNLSGHRIVHFVSASTRGADSISWPGAALIRPKPWRRAWAGGGINPGERLWRGLFLFLRACRQQGRNLY